MINRSTEHPTIPEKSRIQRVKNYWSIMVIKADTDVDEVSDCIVSTTLVLRLEVSEKENGFNVNVLHKCHTSVRYLFNMYEYYHSYIQIQDWCWLTFSWYQIEILYCIHVNQSIKVNDCGTFLWDVTTPFQILVYSSLMVMKTEYSITFTFERALFHNERIRNWLDVEWFTIPIPRSSILVSSAHHIIPHHVWNPEVHYCVHKSAADQYPKED